MGKLQNIINVEASSQQLEEGYDFSPELAIDNDTTTRWSSKFEDPQWIIFELKDETVIRAIHILWEFASAKVYSIDISKDNKLWKTVAEIFNGTPGEDRIISFNSVSAKYVRIYCKQRNGQWGYSIRECDILK